METVTLQPIYHKQQPCIGIYCINEPSLNKILKSITGSRFTKTYKCWYVFLNKVNYTAIVNAFNGVCKIDNQMLHKYIIENKIVTTTAATQKTTIAIATPPIKPLKQQSVKTVIINKAVAIAAVNAHILPAIRQQLILKAYSPSTIKTYLNEMSQLLQTVGKTDADSLTPELLKRYFVFCFTTLKLTENTLHSRINALKFYYEKVLGREKFFWDIPRPKKPFQLPNVLGEKEITNLFNALTNIKHKAILFTAYSAGLRVSEAVSLRIKDIDSDRMQIKIVAAKGKKDRFVGLSPVVLDILRKYLMITVPRPNHYLFEGEKVGEPYAVRSAQKIFQRAKNIAGIRKEVSFHSLRHSFATHLLEKGIDIRFIKDLLGHFDIRTTEKYTHVRKDKLVNIVSPLDDLWLKGDIL